MPFATLLVFNLPILYIHIHLSTTPFLYISAYLPTYPSSEIRWRAAWALGNAVKNDEDFQHWVLDYHHHHHDDGQQQQRKPNALERLIDILEEKNENDELLRKAVYALTSATRNNPRVQVGR